MLSALEVRNAKPEEKPYKLTDGKGLSLHIATSGKKTWRYRYELTGTESVCVLGEYPIMTLETARIERAIKREIVKAGFNPAEERRKRKQAIEEAKVKEKILATNSFEMVAHEWHAHRYERWTTA